VEKELIPMAKKGKRFGRIFPVRRAAALAQNAQPEELRGLVKYQYEDKLSIVPAKYYHEKARRDKIPEGCVNRSRRRPTKKETCLQQLVDYEQNAIESGAKTWAEIPKATQKLMEEQLSTETIANLKAAKTQKTDEGMKIVADDLLFLTGHTFDNMEEEMETKTERKPSNTPHYGFTAETQRLIRAMMIFDPSVWPEVRELVLPEYFENTHRAEIVAIAQSFYDKYKRPPSMDECFQELDCFLKNEEARGHSCPEGAHLNELMAIVDAVADVPDFSYIHEQVRKFAKFNAMKNAFIKGVDRLRNDQDYDGIVKDVLAAASIGNEKDTEGLDDIVAAEVREEPIEWLWHDILPRAALSVIVGMPSSGKSWFSMMVAARVSAGCPFPTHEQFRAEQGQVLILQSEDSWANTCTRRLRLEGADMSQVHFVKGMKHKDAIRPVDLSTDLEKVRQRMRELGNVKLIIVDPLDAYVGLTRHFDTHKGREVRLALRPLEIFIETEQVAVLGIMHLNKSQISAVIHRISGSAAWAQVPRAIWAIVPKRDTPDVRQFLSVKSNTVRDVDRRLAEFCFRISEEQNRIELAPDEEPGNVSEELAPARPEDMKDRSTKLALAITVLEDLKDIAAEGLPASMVMNELPGIGQATWMTARKRTGWTTQQASDGWRWYPPKADPSQK
jgi:hypothetical protein